MSVCNCNHCLSDKQYDLCLTRPDAFTAKVTAPIGWRIYSIKPYCGSLSSLVVEFQNVVDGRVKTLYGTVPSIQEQLEDRW